MQRDNIQLITRLNPEVYAELLKKLPVSLHVDSDTSPMQAGFQLGMARVLQELREGYVVSVG